MNYTVNVLEFWIYVLFALITGVFIMHFYYDNILVKSIEKAVKLRERELKVLYEERTGNLLIDISIEKDRFLNLKNKFQNMDANILELVKEKEELCFLVGELNLKCDGLIKKNELYEVKHKQIEFEVATVQKYYKDARIDTNISFLK